MKQEDFQKIYNGREGTSQRTRLDPNLLPESFLIDGRSPIDLVNAAIEFSKSLNYYDTEGKPTTGWEDFFVRDRAVFLYVIAHTNMSQIQNSFYLAYEFVNNLTDSIDRREHIDSLVSPIREMVDLLRSWRKNFGFAEISGDDLLRVPNLEPYKDFAEWRNKMLAGGNLEQVKSIFEEIYSSIQDIIRQANERIMSGSESGQNVSPHMALFIGFLKVYGVLQKRLNGLTKKHLDYYYYDFLNLQRKIKTPDETYVRFELNEKYASYFLEKGTSVSGGKDLLGMPIVYQTISNVELTNTKIKGLYTLFVSQNKLNYSGEINTDHSEDQYDKVTDIYFQKHDPESITSMKLFGEDQFFKAETERTMESADVGFIVASKNLYLEEGDRKICIDLIATGESYKAFREMVWKAAQAKSVDQPNYTAAFNQIFRTAFDIFIVQDGIEIKHDDFCVRDLPQSSGISIELMLTAGSPPVTALKEEDQSNNYGLNVPYVKVLLREESHIYAYSLIHKFDIANIKLRLFVKGLKNLMLYNNYGQIDPSNPFQLFGAIPKVKSYFLLGNQELVSKSLINFDLAIEWYQLPIENNGLEDYFSDYTEQIENDDYQVRFSYLHAGEWKPIRPDAMKSLFREVGGEDTVEHGLSDKTHFNGLILPVDPTSGHVSLNLEPYELSTRNGYLKMELAGPEFAFGFDSYQKDLNEAIRYNAKIGKGDRPKAPNPPFSPMVKNIWVNYEAEASILQNKKSGSDIEILSIGPLGYKKRELRSAQFPVKLLLDFEPEGQLMIGLDQYPKKGKINFFFNPDLSTLAPDPLDVPEVKWQFLENNSWKDIAPSALEIDNTRNFLQSGIISIRIPSTITNNNTLIDDDLFWIRATISENSYIVPEVMDIYTNVQRVKWDQASDGAHLGQPLPGHRITKMHDFDPKIVQVEQLLQPFNGKLDETEEGFYSRISERLRHKDRVCTNWDYERLLLEQYPMIYKAKCFNGLDTAGMVKPGCLTIAVTPDIRSPLVSNRLEPKFGIKYLDDMRRFVRAHCSPFAEVHVINAHYEKIRVICQVGFKGKLNPNNYISRLNDEIIEYLTPWIASNELDEQFGSSQYRSKIITFVNQRPYVSFVTAFSLVKINAVQGRFELYDTESRSPGKSALEPEISVGSGNSDLGKDLEESENGKFREEIQPKYPWSILTSVERHDITSIEKKTYQKPARREIGNMKLGVDFGIQV